MSTEGKTFEQIADGVVGQIGNELEKIKLANERVDRYQGLLPAATLKQTTVAVIGVGAVGRQAAIQCVAMGVGNVIIVDFDKVEPHNMGPQGYWPQDLGKFKVDALAEELLQINPAVNLTVQNAKFDPEHIKGVGYVLSCVDDMHVRKAIFEAATSDMLDLILFADARMNAEQCVAHYVTDEKSATEWLRGWYPPSEIKTGCTEKATIYCASMAGCLLVSGVSKAIRRVDLPFNFYFNLLGMSTEANWKPEVFETGETPAEEPQVVS